MKAWSFTEIPEAMPLSNQAIKQVRGGNNDGTGGGAPIGSNNPPPPEN